MRVHRTRTKQFIRAISTHVRSIINWIIAYIKDVLYFKNVDVFPGISDHLIVMFDIDMKPKSQSKVPRKLYNYNKANLDTLKEKTKLLSHEFLESDPGRNSVNSNWKTN